MLSRLLFPLLLNDDDDEYEEDDEEVEGVVDEMDDERRMELGCEECVEADESVDDELQEEDAPDDDEVAEEQTKDEEEDEFNELLEAATPFASNTKGSSVSFW
jgi:hypothetical protein